MPTNTPLIYQRWPPENPESIQLYSINSPNGIKIAVALEELGLDYDAHLVNLFEDDQHTDAFRSVSPNGKIPAIIDPQGPGGEPLAIMESGAILIYLADKAGQLIPHDPAGRSECIQWLFFQVGHIGPMFGQFEHFYEHAGDNCRDPYPTQRYADESRRLLGVLEGRLENREWIVDADYTIADIAIFPWVYKLKFTARKRIGMADFPTVNAWLARCMDRPATKKGRFVCEP